MQPEGTITLNDAGLVTVVRPDDTTDTWWEQVTGLLAPSAAAVSDTCVAIRAGRAPHIDTFLSRAPASTATWTWTPAATAAVAVQADIAADLATLTGTPAEDQAAAPADVDLAAEGFTRTLRPVQETAYARLVNAHGGANFSVPGSGKTTVTYAVYTALRARGLVHGMLVIAPPSAFEAWETEAHDCYAEDARPTVSVRPDTVDRTAEVVVYNYERLASRSVRADIARWARNRNVLVVFDEAHRAKAGQASRRGATAAEVARSSEYRMILTGTPMPNDESDLVAVMDLVWPGHGERLVAGDLAGHLDRTFVRITKTDLHLPPLDITVVPVELDPAHRRLYDAMVDRVDEWANGPDAKAAEAGKAVMRLIAAATNPAAVFAADEPWTLPLRPGDQWDLAGLVDQPLDHIRPAKIVAAAAAVADNRARGRKTLVWSNFVNNVDAIAAALAHHHPAIITGSTAVDDPRASTDRVRQLDQFRNHSDCWVLVATPQTLGEGVSLHHTCTDQIHVDRGYAAGTWLQSIDRTHRLGLPDTAISTCTVFEAAGTIDERVSIVLADKVQAMATRLDDPTLRAVSDPFITPDTTTTAVLGDVDALRELIAACRNR